MQSDRPQADRISMTLAGETATLEREIETLSLDTVRIWDVRLSPGERLVGVLRFPDGVREWIRGQVIFSGQSAGREFSTVAMRPETWDGFLALVRYRSTGIDELASAAA